MTDDAVANLRVEHAVRAAVALDRRAAPVMLVGGARRVFAEPPAGS